MPQEELGKTLKINEIEASEGSVSLGMTILKPASPRKPAPQEDYPNGVLTFKAQSTVRTDGGVNSKFSNR